MPYRPLDTWRLRLTVLSLATLVLELNAVQYISPTPKHTLGSLKPVFTCCLQHGRT